MRVLVACEFSGVVRRAFRKLGHNAWSCDLIPAEDTSPFHFITDVMEVVGGTPSGKWDLMIFHAPCTRLCNSGVRWLAERNLWDEMREAALFFKSLLDADIPQIAGENPIPHRYALDIIGRKYTQIVQPWMFGDYQSKATALWLKGLPQLVPTYKKPEECREALGFPAGTKLGELIHRMPPGPSRSKERSRTFEGIARAMSEQWG